MTTTTHRACIVLALWVAVTGAFAQDRSAGTAVIHVGENEYTIPIECDDASRPELGFSTEPSRITKEATGRTSGLRLGLRRWQETDDVVISLDRYVAWMPRPSSAGGVLKMTLDMSPVTIMKGGSPVALTYDMWMEGERPQGIQGVSFEAQCSHRDPDAPAFRKLPSAESR